MSPPLPFLVFVSVALFSFLFFVRCFVFQLRIISFSSLAAGPTVPVPVPRTRFFYFINLLVVVSLHTRRTRRRGASVCQRGCVAMPRLESKQADRSSSRRHHNRGDDEEEKNEGAAAAAAAAIQFSDDDDGGGIFSNGGGGGGSQVLDAGLSEAEAKRLEKISVKAWLIRKQHYTPLVDMLPRLIKFLNGDFDPLDDEEDHGIPLWRRFMDSCDEGECHHFVGRCMAAVHTFIGRRYRAIGYTQSNSANTKAGGGRAAKKSVKASDWPTDLGRRFTNFLCHKDTEFVFENVPVKPSFYERYSKYGKRSFEKIRKDDGGDGDGDGSSGSDDDGGRGRGRGRHAAADDSEKPTHMKTRVVFAYGVAQKGKAPKPLKPDEILTNQLFKRQCKVMWGKLLRETEDLVHNMVNRELYKRSQVFLRCQLRVAPEQAVARSSPACVARRIQCADASGRTPPSLVLFFFFSCCYRMARMPATLTMTQTTATKNMLPTSGHRA